MKKTASLAFSLFVGTATLASVHHVAVMAQTSMPDETSRPVIKPGKAGPQGQQGPSAATPAIETTVGEIRVRPQMYANRNVTVTSAVEEVFTPWSLKLDDDSLLAGGIDNDLLVVSAEPLATMGFDPSWVKKGKVSVTGTVRILQAADFRREYGRGVDDKLFRRYEGKPALIAISMKRIE